MAETTTTTETTTETIDVASLQAELAELRADFDRVKRSNDDLSRENAGYKRKERERMGEDERKQEEQEERERRYAELEKQLAMRDYADQLSDIGDKKSVDKIVGLLAEGKIVEALKEMKTLRAKTKSEIEVQIRDELMQKNPQPSAEGEQGGMTVEKIAMIKDPIERQRVMAENLSLYGL